jgi:hypothetical protein
MLRHTDSPTDQSPSLHDKQLRKFVNDACARIQAEFSRRAPFLGEQACGWMAHLSPAGEAPEYFLQPRSFPLLRLIWWAAKSFTTEPDCDFLADVVYSTVNGYYYIRLLDNLMDGHGTVELKILPATAFFHTEFQATYHKYFDAAHPFWEVFRSAWFSASEAVTREDNLDRIHQAEFDLVTVAKLAGARIPLAAVGFRHGAGERLRCWEEFTLALARWSQMEDDLFDWHHDLLHGKTSYFLTEASQHKGFESVDAWVIREGFQQGMEILQRELFALRRLVPSLHSPDVVRYLDSREAILESQMIRIGEAFQILKDVASITEPKAQPSDQVISFKSK